MLAQLQTIADFADFFEVQARAQLRSFHDVASCVRVHIRPALGSERPEDIQPGDLRLFFSAIERARSPSLADRAQWIVASILDLAIEAGRIEENVARGLRWKRSDYVGLDASVEVLEPAEVSRIIMSAPNRAFWTILVLEGLRAGEGAALNWGSIEEAEPLLRLRVARSLHQKTGEIGPTKTGAVRLVPLHPVAQALIESERARFRRLFFRDPRPDDPLFVYRRWRGEIRRWATRRALTLWRRELGDLGIEPRRLHATRHTFISLLLRAGAPERVVRLFTHQKPKKERNPFDMYVHLDSWADRCEAILRFPLPGAVLPMPGDQLDLFGARR